ncbi:MAG: HutP family protein [Bacillota bacterium]
MLDNNIFIPSNLTAGRAAMLIAITDSRKNEEEIKKYLYKRGFSCAATEIGGTIGERFYQKLTDALIGAALNNNVIRKKSKSEVHAIIHASREAQHGFLLDVPSAVNVGIKIAIVKKDNWISVAMFGNAALHDLTNHNRTGLGTMHI